MRLQNYINEANEKIKEWKEYVKSNPMLSASISVLDKIHKRGYKAWIVGGAVRDIVIGKEPKDVDIVTNCDPKVLSEIWKLHPIGNSGDFGIWLIKEGGHSFEIAQLRSESYAIPKVVRKIL